MTSKWIELGKKVTHFTVETDSFIVFKRFVLGAYSDDVDLALAIVGLSDEGKTYLISTWQFGSGQWKEWLDEWAEKLKYIAFYFNRDGAAAMRLLGVRNVSPRRIEENIKKIDLVVELKSIESVLYPSWHQLREGVLLRPGAPVLGCAALLGARACRKRIGSALSGR